MTAGARLLWSLVLVAGVAPSAHAGSFLQAYEAAIVHDAAYRAARQAALSAAQGVPIARSGLLPSVSLSVSDARVTGSRSAPDVLGRTVTTPLDYRSPQQTLSVRAPLINMEAWQRTRQAEAQLRVAESVLLTRHHELLDRLGQAFLQRQFALQNQALATAQLANAREMYQLAVRQFELGDGTRPEVSSAEAGVALATVQVTEGDNQVTTSALALAQITGLPALEDPLLGDDYVAPSLAPATLNDWLDRALASNPDLAARRLVVDLARVGVDRAGAGHYPRLDLVASLSKGRNDSISTLNQALTQRSLGVQFNLPLYSGGVVEATKAQASAELEKAQAELDAEQLTVQADMQRYFLLVLSGQERLQAQQKQLDASRLVLEGAQKSFAAGMGIRADVVRAQSRVGEALRDRAKARFEHLLALLRLHARAGTPPPDIARLLDAALSAPALHANR